MKTRIILTVIGIVSALFLTNTSCQKHTDVKATVICVDSVGRAMPGANVKIFAYVKNKNNSTFVADVKAEGLTDNSGKVSFVFKLPAIFDIKAALGSLTGTGIIKVDEPGKEAEKTVIIR